MRSTLTCTVFGEETSSTETLQTSGSLTCERDGHLDKNTAKVEVAMDGSDYSLGKLNYSITLSAQAGYEGAASAPPPGPYRSAAALQISQTLLTTFPQAAEMYVEIERDNSRTDVENVGVGQWPSLEVTVGENPLITCDSKLDPSAVQRLAPIQSDRNRVQAPAQGQKIPLNINVTLNCANNPTTSPYATGDVVFLLSLQLRQSGDPIPQGIPFMDEEYFVLKALPGEQAMSAAPTV